MEKTVRNGDEVSGLGLEALRFFTFRLKCGIL